MAKPMAEEEHADDCKIEWNTEALRDVVERVFDRIDEEVSHDETTSLCYQYEEKRDVMDMSNTDINDTRHWSITFEVPKNDIDQITRALYDETCDWPGRRCLVIDVTVGDYGGKGKIQCALSNIVYV